MTNEQLWQAVLGELELTLSKANFTTWFKHTHIISAKDGNFIIGVPNGFTKEWLENKYHKDIARALQNVANIRVKKIVYTLSSKENLEKNISNASNLKKEVETESQKTDYYKEKSLQNLNPRYTFSNFVVGPNNELARAAALAVTKNPGTTYNPLFIYGGVGLGKTHLIQAIGNEVVNRDSKKKVVYITCEKFMEDFISSLQKGQSKASAFKNKYRNVDFLLIDDIQFLGGKEGTQIEFFHTFNTLYQNNKQIVITSDRPPKAIPGLEDRLVSRFEGGMIADISMPDLETRKAILIAKCKEKNITMPEGVLNYIATNIQNNIRELEGALSRIIARCQLSNIQPSEELARSVLSNTIADLNRKALTLNDIIDTVSKFYGIQPENLIARNRKKEVAWPRQVAMYLIRDEIKISYPSIGQKLGGRDHTTAIHAYEKVSKEIEKNDNIRQEIDVIRQKLYYSSNVNK